MMKKSENVVWHQSQISDEDRRNAFRQKGSVLWFTGLSGSGKSTIAHALEHALIGKGHHAFVLDGDNVRHGLCGDLGFSDEDRAENIRRISELSKLFADCGMLCLAAFISPFKAGREQARKIIGPDRFIEVYVSASLDVCEARDTKGLYKKARQGEIADFTGVDSPYEPPEKPELTLASGDHSLADCVGQAINMLISRNVIFPKE